MQTQIQTTRLPNGITVVTDQALHFQAAAISMKFAVGSAHEPEELSGISHLLEHLIFRGSDQLNGSVFQQAIGAAGANINGQTNEDTTTYTASMLNEDLGPTLKVFADVLCNPKLDEEDIKLEKQIIEQENCRGCASCTMRDSLYAVAYPNQPLRHPVVGYEDTIESITRDDLLAYHAQHYVTGNLIVSVVSGAEHEDVVAHVKDAFANLPNGPRSAMPIFEFTPGEIGISSGGDRAAIQIHYDLSGLTEDQCRCLYYYSEILGGHGFSKLMEELREKRGLVYSAWTFEDEIGANRFMNVSAWCDSRKITEVTDLIGKCMYDLAHNLTEQDLNEAKRRCRTSILQLLDNLTLRADMNAADELYGVTVRDPFKRIETYLDISLEDLRNVSQELLKLEPAIFLGGSQRSMPSFDRVRAALKGEDAPEKPKRGRLFSLVN